MITFNYYNQQLCVRVELKILTLCDLEVATSSCFDRIIFSSCTTFRSFWLAASMGISNAQRSLVSINFVPSTSFHYIKRKMYNHLHSNSSKRRVKDVRWIIYSKDVTQDRITRASILTSPSGAKSACTMNLCLLAEGSNSHGWNTTVL